MNDERYDLVFLERRDGDDKNRPTLTTRLVRRNAQANERLRALASSRRAKSAHTVRNAKARRVMRDEDGAHDREMDEASAVPRPKAEAGQRERRLFAGLLGTLRKSKSNIEEKEKEVLAKRKSIEAAVSGKNEEISRELKEAQYKAFLEKREADERKKFELDLKFKETEGALIEAEYEEMKSKIHDGGILTTTEPVLVYKPKNPTSEDAAASQMSLDKLDAWRASQLERIRKALETIRRRREEIAERRAQAKARGEAHDDVDVEDAEEGDDAMEGDAGDAAA